MKTIKIEKVNSIIEGYDVCIKENKRKRDKIIAEHADEINRIIEQKIKALSGELKNSAIYEVCGKELTAIDNDTKEMLLKKGLLEGLIEDVEEPSEYVDVQGSVEDTPAPAEPNAAAEEPKSEGE